MTDDLVLLRQENERLRHIIRLMAEELNNGDSKNFSSLTKQANDDYGNRNFCQDTTNIGNKNEINFQLTPDIGNRNKNSFHNTTDTRKRSKSLFRIQMIPKKETRSLSTNGHILAKA